MVPRLGSPPNAGNLRSECLRGEASSWRRDTLVAFPGNVRGEQIAHDEQVVAPARDAELRAAVSDVRRFVSTKVIWNHRRINQKESP
jgi:hypothetical protein